jgi:phosphoserine phosphatase RsbU/P
MLQESLLPSDLPEVPGVDLAARYRPCVDGIGGDFYDVFGLPDGRWGIVMGDVCGKGADAAALTARARHGLCTAAWLQPDPAAALAVLNEALRPPSWDFRFCTAVYAVLEPRERGARLTVARAGHPAALVARADGVIPVGGEGRLLGVFPDTETSSETVDLEPGDAVLLHTDGLTDFGSLDDADDPHEPGMPWVRRTLARHREQGAAAIVDALVHATGDAPGGLGRDDIAVLALAIPPAR